ncbi:MAG: hypothetical protein KAI17_03385 [Thiotrichaceae bacterium]|nr:hypothetical protein [Thiotrichaceae bacterium]
MKLCHVDRIIEADPALKASTGVLLRIISKYANLRLGCILKNETLAKKVHITTGYLERLLKKLTELGYILREHLLKDGCIIVQRKIELCLEKFGIKKMVKNASFSKKPVSSETRVNSTENQPNLNTSRPPQSRGESISKYHTNIKKKESNKERQREIGLKTHAPMPTPPTEKQKEELRSEFEQVLAVYPKIPEQTHDIGACKRAYSRLRLTHHVKIETILEAIDDLKITHENQREISKKWADLNQPTLPPLNLFLDIQNIHVRLAVRRSKPVTGIIATGLTPRQRNERRKLKKQFEAVSAELRQAMLKGDDAGTRKATAKRAYINEQIAKI